MLKKIELWKVESWKIAKVIKEMRDTILKRDNYKCCLCWSINMLDIHHALFGTETIYDTTRNTPVNLITVCRDCHESIHECRKWEWKRQEAINILNEYYSEMYDRSTMPTY